MVVEQFEDCVFSVTEINEVELGFKVAKVIGISLDQGGIPSYRAEGNGSTDDFEKAELFLSGSIKWDGCSNWDFHDHDGMAHFCGKNDATGLGRLMDHLYTITSERLTTYDKDIGG